MNYLAPAPSASDVQYCACCEAPFGIDYETCDCEGEVDNGLCELHQEAEG